MILEQNKTVGSIIVISAILLFRVIYLKLRRKYLNYPTGPVGIPLLGSLFQIYKAFVQFSDVLNENKVVMFYVVGRPWVFINDYKLFNSNFKSLTDSFASKFSARNFSNLNGQKWKRRRKINNQCFTSLTTSNYVDTILNSLLKQKLFPLFDAIKPNTPHFCGDDIFYLQALFTFGIFNGIDSKMPSQTECQLIKKLMKQRFVVEFTENIIRDIISLIPILSIREYIKNKLSLNISQYEKEHALRHMIINPKKNLKFDNCESSYLQKMSKYVDSGEISSNEMYADATLLFVSVIHSPSQAIEAAIYNCSVLDDIQEMVYNELKKHHNLYKKFDSKHMNELHLFRAFVHESMRYQVVNNTNLTPSKTIPRYIQNAKVVGGYNIPVGSLIFGNVSAIHQNEAYWKNAKKFDIYNFLDEKNRFVKSEYFVRFGKGKRGCPGTALSMKGIYYILSALIYRYKFCKAKKENGILKTPMFIQQRQNIQK
eukprot:447196_1